MDESVAKTARIVSRRQLYRFIYLIILFMVAVIIGFLVWIYYDNQKLHNSDIEQYDQIVTEITAQNEILREIDSQIQDRQKELEESESNKEMIDVLNEISTLYTQAILINEFIIEKHSEVFELNVEEKYVYISSSSIEQLNEKSSEYLSEIERIDRETGVLTYYISLDDALRCYGKVNLKGKPSAIEKSKVGCDKELQETMDIVTGMSVSHSATTEYLKSIQKFWDKNVELYYAIEKQDEKNAKTLEEEIGQIVIERQEAQEKSEAEMSQIISNQGEN